MSANPVPPDAVTLTLVEVVVLSEIIKAIMPDAQLFGYFVALTLAQRAKETEVDLEAESDAFVSLMTKLSNALANATAQRDAISSTAPTVTM